MGSSSQEIYWPEFDSEKVVIQPLPIIPSYVEDPVLNETKTKIDKFKEDSINILPKTTAGLSYAFQRYKSIDIPETSLDKQKFVYFIMEYFIYDNWFSVVENNWTFNVVSSDPSEYTQILTQDFTNLLNKNWIDSYDVNLYLASKKAYKSNSQFRDMNPQNLPLQQLPHQRTHLDLSREQTAELVRNPIGSANKILWSMNSFSSLSLIAVSIRAIFWKPFEWKFWKFLAWVAGYWILEAFGITDKLAKTIEWKYDTQIGTWVDHTVNFSKKAFNWAEKNVKEIYGNIPNFSSNLIERVKDWYSFVDIKIWKGNDSKSIVKSDFTDLYNTSEKDDFKDNLFIWDKNIWDEKVKALKWKLGELYGKWIGLYDNKDNFFKAIEGKNIIEVEALISENEQENTKSQNGTTSTSWTTEVAQVNSKSIQTEQSKSTQEKKDNISLITPIFATISWSLATINFDTLKSKIWNLTDYTQEWFKNLNDEISKIVSSADYSKLSWQAKTLFDEWLDNLKKTYTEGINKLPTWLFESFLAGLWSNISPDKIDSYLSWFKSKFTNLSNYSLEWLQELNWKLEVFKNDAKYTALSKETTTKIDTMLVEIQKQYEEKFKNMITVIDQKLDMDNIDNINLDTILIDAKTYSKQELQILISQLTDYKKTDKFKWFDEAKKKQITDFLDELSIWYNKQFLKQEKNTFTEKIASSQIKFIDKFKEFADKNYNNPEELSEKQNQIAEFDKKLQTKITWLDIDKVLDINGLEKLTFEYKLFETILNNYLEGRKKWDITKFIDWYVFNDIKPYELWEQELLELVKEYDLKWNDQYNNQRKNNEVFTFIKGKANDLLSDIDQKENAVLVNLYKKYLDNELSYGISSIKTPLGIGSITINDIDEHFKPKDFIDWKNEMIW